MSVGAGGALSSEQRALCTERSVERGGMSCCRRRRVRGRWTTGLPGIRRRRAGGRSAGVRAQVGPLAAVAAARRRARPRGAAACLSRARRRDR